MYRRAYAIVFLGTLLAAAHAEESAGMANAQELPYRFEFRRENTDRTEPGETTKTTLRLEKEMEGGIRRIRFDLPLPDDKESFSGSIFEPRLGDVKLRAMFHSFAVSGLPIFSDVEVTFPTAGNDAAGTGKYQASAALSSRHPLAATHSDTATHRWLFEWLARQTASVAGDDTRKDISNTKLELGVRDRIDAVYWLKLNLKPTLDWMQGGKSGAVLELEGGWDMCREWRFTLKGGGRAWGDASVPGIYGKRFEWVVSRAF